jgi:hypothetical protein
VTTFDLDEHTAELIAQVRDTFGVKTNAAVLHEALVLASVASQHAGSDRTITTISDDGKQPVKVSLAG